MMRSAYRSNTRISGSSPPISSSSRDSSPPPPPHRRRPRRRRDSHAARRMPRTRRLPRPRRRRRRRRPDRRHDSLSPDTASRRQRTRIFHSIHARVRARLSRRHRVERASAAAASAARARAPRARSGASPRRRRVVPVVTDDIETTVIIVHARLPFRRNSSKFVPPRARDGWIGWIVGAAIQSERLALRRPPFPDPSRSTGSRSTETSFTLRRVSRSPSDRRTNGRALPMIVSRGG